jgi:hypothetical protein
VDIDDMKLGDLKKIAAMFSGSGDAPTSSGFEGRYVIVRCKDAGVHAGVLVADSGRTATLKESRRLWYWKSNKGSFLSGVARDGLDEESKVGGEVDIHLTETCEIIPCSEIAEKSIRGIKAHERD